MILVLRRFVRSTAVFLVFQELLLLCVDISESCSTADVHEDAAICPLSRLLNAYRRRTISNASRV